MADFLNDPSQEARRQQAEDLAHAALVSGLTPAWREELRVEVLGVNGPAFLQAYLAGLYPDVLGQALADESFAQAAPAFARAVVGLPPEALEDALQGLRAHLMAKGSPWQSEGQVRPEVIQALSTAITQASHSPTMGAVAQRRMEAAARASRRR